MLPVGSDPDVASGITVVALTNTNPPTVETSTLTQQLLTIALANPWRDAGIRNQESGLGQAQAISC